MSVTITISDSDVAALRSILGAVDVAMQLPLYKPRPKRSKRLLFAMSVYEALYWNGYTARSLALQYGVNHNHFIRVWHSIGLNTGLLASQRTKVWNLKHVGEPLPSIPVLPADGR